MTDRDIDGNLAAIRQLIDEALLSPEDKATPEQRKVVLDATFVLIGSLLKDIHAIAGSLVQIADLDQKRGL